MYNYSMALAPPVDLCQCKIIVCEITHHDWHGMFESLEHVKGGEM
jgi:hypothetical protein